MSVWRVPWKLNVGMFLGQTGASICVLVGLLGYIAHTSYWLAWLVVPHFLGLYALCRRAADHDEVTKREHWKLWMFWGGIVVCTLGPALDFFLPGGLAGLFNLLFLGAYFAALTGSSMLVLGR